MIRIAWFEVLARLSIIILDLQAGSSSATLFLVRELSSLESQRAMIMGKRSVRPELLWGTVVCCFGGLSVQSHFRGLLFKGLILNHQRSDSMRCFVNISVKHKDHGSYIHRKNNVVIETNCMIILTTARLSPMCTCRDCPRTIMLVIHLPATQLWACLFAMRLKLPTFRSYLEVRIVHGVTVMHPAGRMSLVQQLLHNHGSLPLLTSFFFSLHKARMSD